jgi:hypothetical protein
MGTKNNAASLNLQPVFTFFSVTPPETLDISVVRES